MRFMFFKGHKVRRRAWEGGGGGPLAEGPREESGWGSQQRSLQGLHTERQLYIIYTYTYTYRYVVIICLCMYIYIYTTNHTNNILESSVCQSFENRVIINLKICRHKLDL